MTLQKSADGPVLKLEGWTTRQRLGTDTVHIEGTVTCLSDRLAIEAEAIFLIYDKSGARIDTRTAYITFIQPGETWKFSIPVYDADAIGEIRFFDLAYRLAEPDIEK